MRVTVNGTPRELPAPMDVARLLEELELRGTLVAVELNREVVPRDRWSATALDEGDVVEIVHFVGGG